VTLIWRADGLDTVLAALAARFGAAAVLPVHPKPDAPAIRVLVRAVKASRAPLALLPGLFLADAGGRPSPQADAVLRDGALLPLANQLPLADR
jgi:tRNA1(Val) A37 N6-methylase TrmN6